MHDSPEENLRKQNGFYAKTRHFLFDELRRSLGPTAHAEALATLRRYDQGLLSEKQVARSMDRLFTRGRDDELRDAFRYFLPAELAV